MRVRLLAVVLLALLPIALLLTFLWIGARERDRKDALLNLAQTAEAVAVIADDVFDEGIVFGRAIATDPSVKTLDPVQFVPRLRELQAQAPHVATLVVVGRDGTVLGWSAPDPLPVPAPSVDARSFFTRVIASGRPTTIRMVGGQRPTDLENGVAVPILDGSGNVAGLVAVAFDPDHVSSRLAQIRLFPGQVLSLIDPNGRTAVQVGQGSSPLADLTWEQRDRSAVPEVQAALAGQAVTTSISRSTLASPGTESRLAALIPTPRHGWVVSTTWSEAEALGPTRQAEQRELAIFIGIVTVILAGALATSRGLIAPLRRLAEHARALGDGRFEPVPATGRDDEIGDLTGTFNAMGARLQQTLDELRQERSLLETVLQSLPVGVALRAAPSEELILGNIRAEQIFRHGLTPDNAAARTMRGINLHPDGSPYAREEYPIIRALRTGEEVRDEEILIRRGDGTEGIIVMSATPIRDPHGQIIAAVTSFDDVTERRQIEARLREREQTLGALVDQFPGTVAVFDRDLRYVLAAGRSLVDDGRPRHALVGTRLADAYAPADAEAIASTCRQAFEGETVSCDLSVVGRLIRFTITPLRDASGAVARVLSVAFDITEERAQIDRRTREEKLHALGQMAGGIAHDLNQTLALVTGYGELARDALDRDPPDLDGLRQMMRIVERAAYDGGETVKRLLTFSRGHDNELRQPVDVAELLHEVAQLTMPRWRESARAEGHPVELEVRAEPELLVLGSPSGLREALINLVFNALDAMPSGGSIVLAARRSGDRVLIEIQDTGTGMTPEVQRQVFEPFFTTKGEQGTGLGLAMVFGIVRQHGGQIDVLSEPGQGTTMRLSLPAGVAEADDAAPEGGETSKRSLRILVVDDDTRLAALAAGMLRRDGHQVTEAFSGQEALEHLRAAPFDLMITDLSMGDGMNGWDLAAEAGRVVPGLPVILVTGWGAAIDEEEARSRGVRAVLSKPFRIADLRSAIARVLPT